MSQDRQGTLLILFGYCFGLGFTALVALTFYVAFFHGYSVVVMVNDFNEALIEFFLIPLLIVVEVIGAIFLMKGLFKMPRKPSQKNAKS